MHATLVLSIAATLASLGPVSAYPDDGTVSYLATETGYVANIETTNPLDDLLQDSSFKSQYELGTYDQGSSGDYQIVRFCEYAYDPSERMGGGLAFYIYVWNPVQGREVDYSCDKNRIQLATNLYGDSLWKKYSIRRLSQSKGEQFIKYKVEGFVPDNLPAERLYSVSGIELLRDGDYNATEYGIGTLYTYTGYASGIQGNSQSTLQCKCYEEETISLEVSGGSYRTDTSDKGSFYRYDVFYVWFGIPDSILEKYGKLNQIHFEYWLYQLKTLYILMDNYFDTAQENMDDLLGTGDKPGTFATSESGDRLTGAHSGYVNKNEVDKSQCFLAENDPDDPAKVLSAETIRKRFYELEAEGNHLYDPEENANAYVEKTIREDETFDLLSYGETHNGWIAFWEGMLGHTGTTYRDIPCIEKIDVASSESFVAEDYFVDPDDEHDIRQFIADCDSQSKTPYIFRFAATDYYVNYLQRVVNAHVKPQVGWAVHECSVVVDFDIIDLGFIGDSEALTILPVVSNPIDIFVDIDVPDSGSDSGPNWWMILLVILCTILVLWIIYKLVLPIASYSSSVSANRKLRKLLKEQKKKDNANGKEGNDP